MRRHLLSLLGDSAVYGLSGVASSVLAFALVPVYTRTFSPSDYGVLSVVTSVTALLASVSVLALDSATQRWFFDTTDDEDRRTTVATWAWCQLACASGLLLLLAVLAGPLTQALGLPTKAAGLLRLSALAVPLSVGATVAVNWFRMRRRPWGAVGIGVGLAAVSAVLSVLLVVALDRGLTGLLLGQVLGQATILVVAVAVMRRGWLDPRRVRRVRGAAMLRYSLPLVPASVATWVVQLMDRSLVQGFRGEHEAGLYALGCSLGALVALGTTAFQLAWGPFALALAAESPDSAGPVFGRLLLVYVWAAGLLAALASALAPWAVATVAPGSYAGAATVVGPIAFSYLLVGLTYVAATGPTLARTTSPIAVGTTLAAIATISLNLLLIPPLGRNGAAVATLLSWAIVPAWVFWRGQKLLHLPFPFTRAVAVGALLASAAVLAHLVSPGRGAWDALLAAAVVVVAAAAAAPWALKDPAVAGAT